MFLTNDVKTLILTYLPLKTLQILDEIALDRLFLSIPILTSLLKQKYNLALPLTTEVIAKLTIEPFELYCNYAMRSGDIGYNGQWYLPPYACLFNSIKNDDIDLLQYYLLRYFVNNNWDLTKDALDWKNDKLGNNSALVNILLYLSKNDKIKNLIINYILIATGSDSKYLDVYNQALSYNIAPDFELNLLYLDSTRLDDYSQIPFPDIDLDDLYEFIRRSGFIPFEVFDQAELMYDKVSKIFAPSVNRDYYLNFLAVLLGKDVDINLIIKTRNNGTRYVPAQFTNLVITVMNYTMFDKLNKQKLLIGLNDYDIVPSMIIYDTRLANNPNLYDYIQNTFAVSLYLSNKSIGVTRDYVSMIPLIKIYKSLRVSNKEIKHVQATVTPVIYDAETALRLADITDVKPYLQPATNFDKNLMIQFGLL